MRLWICLLCVWLAVSALPLGCEPAAVREPTSDGGKSPADAKATTDQSTPEPRATPDPQGQDSSADKDDPQDVPAPRDGSPPKDEGKAADKASEPARPDQPSTTETAPEKTFNVCQPPIGTPRGTRIGNFLRDVELLDCDGKSVKFSDFCNKNAMWISFHHEW